jgi:hypothetical protein
LWVSSALLLWRFFGNFGARYSGCTTAEGNIEGNEGNADCDAAASLAAEKTSPMHHDDDGGYAAADQPLPGSPASSMRPLRGMRAASGDCETARLSALPTTSPRAAHTPLRADFRGSNTSSRRRSGGSGGISAQALLRLLGDVARLWDVLPAAEALAEAQARDERARAALGELHEGTELSVAARRGGLGVEASLP